MATTKSLKATWGKLNVQALYQSLVSQGWLSQAELAKFLNRPVEQQSIRALAEQFPDRNVFLNRCLSIALGIPWVNTDMFRVDQARCTLDISHDNTHGTLRHADHRLALITTPEQLLRSTTINMESGALPIISDEGGLHQLMTKRTASVTPDKGQPHEQDSLAMHQSSGSSETEMTIAVPVSSFSSSSTDNVNDEDAPAVKLLNQVFAAGVQNKASDIHVETFHKMSRIRFRIDGRLTEHDTLSPHLHKQLISRLKILADLDITERRQPQDGRLSISLPGQGPINMRLSILPTAWGEKAVIRIQNHANAILRLPYLGMNSHQQKLVNQSIHRHQGLVLVTGPTGSGKTQTLYSMLEQLNQVERNLVTLEDPVEIDLPGINQVAVTATSQMTFQHALKALLRQDPDVVMLGEIRDTETANTAIKAAQTGHLLLSTLHTNGCIESLVRLINLGIAPYLLSDTLSLIVAQRLVRKLCQHCKQPCTPGIVMDQNVTMKLSTNAELQKPVGCPACHQGYNGRLAIFEVLPITGELSQYLANNGSIGEIRECASRHIHTTLAMSAHNAWEQGLTSHQEVAPYLESVAKPA